MKIVYKDHNNLPYCVYLTVYTGNKLPLFYIGSSSIDRIQHGYCGSVVSKQYQEIWRFEKRFNKTAFKVYILSTFKTRQEATDRESELQSKLNVVPNPLYINKGMFKNGHLVNYGMPTTLGMKMSQETRRRQSLARRGYVHTEETKQKIKVALTGKQKSTSHRVSLSQSKKGKKRNLTDEQRLKLSESHKGARNANYGKTRSQYVKDQVKKANTKYYYEITDLNNDVTLTYSLKEWCIEQQFSNINSALINLRNGTYKGFSCKKIPIPKTG